MFRLSPEAQVLHQDRSARVYGRFPEGFETADSNDAKAPLGALALDMAAIIRYSLCATVPDEQRFDITEDPARLAARKGDPWRVCQTNPRSIR